MALIRSAIALVIALALAGLIALNRSDINLIFSPLHDPISLPLYAVILMALAGGLAIGALLVWFIQGKHRRTMRKQKKQIKSLESQLDSTQNTLALHDPASELFPSIPRKK